MTVGCKSGHRGGYVRVIVLLAVVGLVAAFFAFDLNTYFTLEFLKNAHRDAQDYVAENPLASGVGFFVIYVLVAGLSLPGAVVMTLGAGAIFGMVWGVLIVSFASSVGASIAMLVSRTLLRDWVQDRFAKQLVMINEGIQRDGEFYLFSIRMVPLFPFFIVNLVMGLSNLNLWQFYWVSQAGMFIGTIVFVFAGTQLAQVSSIGDVLSPGLIVALTLLGLFPLAARKSMGWISRARADKHING